MKKVILLIAAVIMVILVIVVTFQYLTVGKIIITTDDPNATITLTNKHDEKSKEILSKEASKTLSLSLKKGEYLVSVAGNSVAASQTVEVRAHKTTTYKINPIKTTGVEPVLTENSRSIAADNTRLMYISRANGELFKIDALSNITKINSPQHFQTIQWADASYGIAQDNKGRLYLIKNDSVSAVNPPVSYASADGNINYSLNSSRQLYLSIGTDIYKGTAERGFKKIYTSTTANPTIIAGSNQLAVIDKSGNEDSPKNTESTLTLVGDSGKKVHKDIDEVYETAWSPSGNYIFISNDSESMVLDSELKEVAIIPNQNVNTPIWLDDNTLLYALSDQLWSYSLQTHTSNVIANMPLGGAIGEITLSQDRSYIYLTAEHGYGNYEIKRVGLRGQAVADFIYQLQNILPDNRDNYSIGLLNFTRPTVIARPYTDSTVNPQALVNSTRTEIQQAGFDINKIQFKFIASDGS
jgi:hypothetical protein